MGNIAQEIGAASKGERVILIKSLRNNLALATLFAIAATGCGPAYIQPSAYKPPPTERMTPPPFIPPPAPTSSKVEQVDRQTQRGEVGDSSLVDQEAYGAMENAFKALRALAVATEVGMNYRDYGEKLIATRISVEQSLGNKTLHVPAAFKTGVDESMRIYQDTHALWEWKLTVRCSVCYYDPGDPHDNVMRPLIRQYPFLAGMIIQNPGRGLLGHGSGTISYDRAISLLLNHAHKKVDELHASLPERPPSSSSAETRLKELRELLESVF